jgi:hypothetical protein
MPLTTEAVSSPGKTMDPDGEVEAEETKEEEDEGGADALVQQVPNMKSSTHMPRCLPPPRTHSQTNMQVPDSPSTRQGLGDILKPGNESGGC